MTHPTHSSARGSGTGRDDWSTPRDLFEAIERRHRLCFALDAACEEHNRMCVTGAVDVDGLKADWSAFGPTWVNPPYSEVRAWMHKARNEGTRVPVACLVPCRPSTRWWAESVHSPHGETCAAFVDLLFGRVKFDGAPSGAPFPSAVVVYLPGWQGPPVVRMWDWRADL
jgi:site-specific DNA-methyltransferase (adenine-specific)